MILIRPETANDHAKVRRVTTEAFSASEFGYNGEADLVERLRACECVLSFVAMDKNEIVGHILFTPASIKNNTKELCGMALGPMAVAPSHQNTGIGASLIRFGLQRLSSDDCPFVIVLGHTEYYPRFGFKRAKNFGIAHGFSGIPQDVFFINILNQDSVQTISNGVAFYLPDFGTQHDGT